MSLNMAVSHEEWDKLWQIICWQDYTYDIHLIQDRWKFSAVKLTLLTAVFKQQPVNCYLSRCPVDIILLIGNICSQFFCITCNDCLSTTRELALGYCYSGSNCLPTMPTPIPRKVCSKCGRKADRGASHCGYDATPLM